jgi:2'-5' RNA ligase
LSIISCYKGFDPAQITVPDYVEMIKKSLPGHRRFEILFRGITASSSCIMIQGFPNNNMLTDIRESLRGNFKKSNLQQTIDQRYSICAAHATVARLRKKLTKKEEYFNVLNNYREYYFGTSEVASVELVSNDWYMRSKKVKELQRFEI